MSKVTFRQTQGDAEQSRSIKSLKSRVGEINIDYVARLANIPLISTEKKTFAKQLGDVLGYISKLSEVDTARVEPIGHITGLTNVVRDDRTAPSITQDEALVNAPKTYNGFFEVDAIFEEQA